MRILPFFILTLTSFSCAKSVVSNSIKSDEFHQLIDQLDFKESPSDIVAEVLNLKLKNLNQVCLVENEIFIKLYAYKEKINNVIALLHPTKRNHTLEEDNNYARIIWQNVFNISRELENCFPDNISLKSFDRWNLMQSVCTEIAKRIRYQNLLTHDDGNCLNNISQQMFECLEQKVETEDTLFFFLLAGLVPRFGNCDDNLEPKFCFLRALKSCNSPNIVTAFKHLLSPPEYNVPCENLQNFQ
ncbi:uncharacterized protein LOC127287747 [Leptopilina boulardi]|uniref:uncharacterized protein LOC127287747 n=1 Tax=Leptopilina boulardi TaxID=63433 RepID=UPI0021F57BB6|nr:uncharacterized protein LOC127287747 [Leptopilina boulardi]